MNDSTAKPSRWRAVVLALLLSAAIWAIGAFSLSRADGPVFIFAGGPFRTGTPTSFVDFDWKALDRLHELEMEIVGTETSLTLWFSVYNDVPYVACDLDCIDGRLTRWPQQIDQDDRVVVRIEGRRVDGRLTHVLHETEEYLAVRAGREAKYAGEGSARAAGETAAHGAVVEVGEVLTGRSKKAEPGDRLFRVDPR